VAWARFTGLKNGQLWQHAEEAGYDVLLTTDKSVPYQQTLGGRMLSVLIVRSRTNQLEDLITKCQAILDALAEIKPGQACFTG